MNLHMYDARAVANEMLDAAAVDGESLSLMKLVKLVYIAHGWHLALSGKPLITQRVEAWKYGPIIPSVFNEFAQNAGRCVGDYRSEGRGGRTRSLPDDEWGRWSKQLLRTVWDKYKHLTAVQLSSIAHQEGTPWAVVATRADFEGQPIPNDMIGTYYKALAAT